MLLIGVAAIKARTPMESDEIIIRCYLNPVPVMVDPGRHHSRYERDVLLGWICQGDYKMPVLKTFPGAEIKAKT